MQMSRKAIASDAKHRTFVRHTCQHCSDSRMLSEMRAFV